MSSRTAEYPIPGVGSRLAERRSMLCALALLAGFSALAIGSLAGSASAAQSATNPAAGCSGEKATVVGTGGSERFKATKHRDVIVALGGNDRVRGLSALDLFCGGPGKDRATKRSIVDAHAPVTPDDPGFGAGLIFGGAGDDHIAIDCAGSTAPVALAWSRVESGPGDDFIDVNCPYSDIVDGGPGDDTIRVGAGADTGYGGEGNDRIVDAYSTDSDCWGDPPWQIGDPFIWCHPAGIIWVRWDDYLHGAEGDDVVIGAAGNDEITGHSGDDELSGGADRDGVSGGDGNDRCDGGPGEYDYVGDGNGAPTADCEGEFDLESETNPGG